jgi:predicted  nucleic acid-binding Zn-ribbon protein
VRNPKELQDLQADVASLKKRLAATEDQELQAMLSFEALQAEVQVAQEHLKAIQAGLENEHHKLIEERAALLRVRENLLSERQAALGAVAAGVVEQYEALRRQRRGVAVAEVLENSCNACGTTLTAALQQSARHADRLVYCPSCGRILYAG